MLKKGFTAACGGFNQRDKQRVKSQSRRSKHLKGCGSKKRRREKKALCSTSLNLLELHVLGWLISTEICGFLQDLGKERSRISCIGGKKFPNTFKILYNLKQLEFLVRKKNLVLLSKGVADQVDTNKRLLPPSFEIFGDPIKCSLARRVHLELARLHLLPIRQSFS